MILNALTLHHTKKGQENSITEKSEKQTEETQQSHMQPIEESKVNFNSKAEGKLDDIIGDIDALGVMIDAFIDQIQDVGVPTFGTSENIRIFLQKRFRELREELSEISDKNRLVSYDNIVCDE